LLIKKMHPFTGKINEMELDITKEDYLRYNYGSELVQNVFPNLTADEREFLITGLMPGEYPGDSEE